MKKERYEDMETEAFRAEQVPVLHVAIATAVLICVGAGVIGLIARVVA